MGLYVLLSALAAGIISCSSGHVNGSNKNNKESLDSLFSTIQMSKEGGILTTTDGATLKIPANVFSEIANIKIVSESAEVHKVPNALSRVYTISSDKPGETSIEQPIVFTIPFNKDNLQKITSGQLGVIVLLKTSGGWLPLEKEIVNDGISVCLFYMPAESTTNIAETNKIQVVVVKEETE